MGLPDFVEYATEAEYREYFERCYVNASSPVVTVDGIVVKFFAENFNHAFFTSSSRQERNKEVFSTDRAKRIDWIRYAIESDGVEVFETTHDNGKKRRLSLLMGDYLVVIQLEGDGRSARFITAFPHDNPDRVRRGPRNKRIWPQKKK